MESQECGCIPAWGLEFCDMLNLEDKTCDFKRNNSEGSFEFLNNNFALNYEPESHDDHRKKRTNLVKECRFSDFMKTDCYDFISNLKQNLNTECNNCPVPCNKTKISTEISSSNSGIVGTITDISFSKDYKAIQTKLKDNTAEEWGEVLYHHFNEPGTNFTDFQKHALSTNQHLEKLIRAYCFRRGKNFDTQGNFYTTILASAMIQVDMFYEDMEVEYLNEELADQWSSLISDMGGQLGLWVGVSLTSAVEIIFFFVWLCKNKFCGKNSKIDHTK